MRVLHLNTFDVGGGAAVAASRLVLGEQDAGMDARLLVQFRRGKGAHVVVNNSFVRTVAAHARYQLDRLSVRRYHHRTTDLFSPALAPDGLLSRIAAVDPDLVHLHWLGFGFCRPETLARLGRSLVWTLHDSWPFTGGCYLPYDCTRYRQSCGACPMLGSTKERDLSRRVWKRKMRAWQGLDLTVVAPSRWLASCAQVSSLFRTARIEVIPNGLDLAQFRPVNRELAREGLGLPRNKNIILFGAVDATSDRNKGFHLLLPAMRKLAAEGLAETTELVVVGAPQPDSVAEFGLPTRYLGRIQDETVLARLYAAADLFVAPSLMENLSTMVMEAMACGTPCVAFDIGGMPDMVVPEKTGFLARPYDPDDLARGILWVLEDRARHAELSRRAREKMEQEFALEAVARRYMALYKEVVNGAVRGGADGK